MTDRPIIFSAPMVRALLAGTKTQTRRLLWSYPKPSTKVRQHVQMPRKIPLAATAPGDRLYVRESMGWDRDGDGRLFYLADGATIEAEPPAGYFITNKSAPSIHMPRWASRLTLVVEAVRVESLWAISDRDAVAEGIERLPGELRVWRIYDGPPGGAYMYPRDSYASLWRSLHGDDSWTANPDVLVLTFRVLPGNIDRSEG